MYIKIIVIILLVTLICIFIYNVINILLNKILTIQKSIKPADGTHYNELNARRKLIQQTWLPTITEELKVCYSNDNLLLKAKVIVHKDSHKWALIIHGYKGKSSDMVGAAKQFYEHDFNTLRIDCRGHGISDGKYIGMGWLDRKDILCWIQEILNIDPIANIVLYGVSMGGATVMMTTGEILPENVKCAIEDCGYTSVDAIFLSQLKRMTKLPALPILKLFNYLCQYKAKYSLFEASALNQLKKSQTPTLFIHGKDDDFIPYQMVYQNYDSCHAKKEMIIFDDAGHGLSSLQNNYYEKVFQFISKYI